MHFELSHHNQYWDVWIPFFQEPCKTCMFTWVMKLSLKLYLGIMQNRGLKRIDVLLTEDCQNTKQIKRGIYSVHCLVEKSIQENLYQWIIFSAIHIKDQNVSF